MLFALRRWRRGVIGMASPPGERAIHLLVAVLHLVFLVGVIRRAQKRHPTQQQKNYPPGHITRPLSMR